MKVLLVTPTLSGETVTAVHVAQDLVRSGHQISFLASADARRLIPRALLRGAFELAADPGDNLGTWSRALSALSPDVVLFADYPLVVSPQSSSPLGEHPQWSADLHRRGVCAVTFDHFGFGQCDEQLVIGPRHLHARQTRFPAVPDGMRIMLPCPMHHPGPSAGRRGDPFHYWDVPLALPEGRRREVRGTYLADDGDLLVMHSVPTWAWKLAEQLRLPFYRHLPDILGYYLEGAGRPVTVVSVNNGGLLAPPSNGSFDIVNLAPMEVGDFEDLLFSADLVITENKASIAMGKAICALQPSVAMKNSFTFDEASRRTRGALRDRVRDMESERPGAVFPFEIFPVDLTGELDKLCLYQDNALVPAFEELEIFGGEPTRDRLAGLLTDPARRSALRLRQERYVDLLRRTEGAAELLERYLREHRAEQASGY